MLNQDNVKQPMIDRLGEDKANTFIMSALTVVGDSTLLQKADPITVVNAVAKSASINLPIDPNLGLAYIIPFNNRKTGKTEAQFQMGYKGFIQLAHRSGQYVAINATKVCEDEIENIDRLTGKMSFNWIQDQNARNKAPVVGYLAYFRLINGFEQYLYMTIEELKAHGLKYSQTAKKGFGLWEDNFEAMAIKTVLKLLLSKYGILSSDMQTAIQSDQAVFRDGGKLEYVDNDPLTLDENNEIKEKDRIMNWINSSTTLDQLQKANDAVYKLDDSDLIDLFEAKAQELVIS